MSNKPRILYVSSVSPVRGPGVIGWGHVKDLRAAGYDVDMLTLYKEPSLPEVLYIKKDNYTNKILTRLKKLFLRLPGRPHYFFYRKESNPPVSIRKVLSKIQKEYELVIVYFWQEMLSFKTVEAIYNKLNHPVVFFICPDYSHMSGGCHFTCDCERYKTGCGRCPAIKSNRENDFTRWNVEYRRRFYEKVKPVVFGNSYMSMFYSQSYLLKDARVFVYPPTFNTTKYKPLNKKQVRNGFGIEREDAFVIAFGCQHLSDPGKGMEYLIEALSRLREKLTEKERNRVLLLVAGRDYEQIKESLQFESIGTGFLPIERLPEFYSVANIFVCPSVDDAGPSMVLQSIACGTPVVGFKMGAMLDVVLGRGTGYCAELKDCEGLAEGMLKYYRMNNEEYKSASTHCRQFAMDNSGIESMVKRWMELYEKYKVNYN